MRHFQNGGDNPPLEITITPREPDAYSDTESSAAGREAAIRSGDPRFAPAPGGDIVEPPPRGALQRILDYGARSPGSGALSGFGSMIGGIGDLYDMATRRTGEAFDYLGVPKTFQVPENLRLDRAFQNYGQGLEQQAQAIDVPPEYQNYGTRGMKATGQLIPQAMAMMTGPLGATTLLGSQGAHQMKPLIDKSGMAGTWQGDAAMIAGSLATAAAERLGLEAMWRGMPTPVKNQVVQKLMSIGAAGGVEAAEEAAEHVMRTLIANNTLGLNESYRPDMDELLAAGFAGKAGRAGSMAAQSTQPGGALNRYFNPPLADAPPPVTMGDFLGAQAQIAGPSSRLTTTATAQPNLELPPLQEAPTTQAGEPYAPAPDPYAVRAQEPRITPTVPESFMGNILQGYDPLRPQVQYPSAERTPKGILSQQIQPEHVIDPVTGFYSKAYEWLANPKVQGKATLDQWKQMMVGKNSKSGVTPYEWEWSGIDQAFADRGNQPIFKDELMNQITAAQPTIREIEQQEAGEYQPIIREERTYDAEGNRVGSEYQIRHHDTQEVIDKSADREELYQNWLHGKYAAQGLMPQTDYTGDWTTKNLTNSRELMTYIPGKEPTHYTVNYYDRGRGADTQVGRYATRAEAQRAANEGRRVQDPYGAPGEMQTQRGTIQAMSGAEPWDDSQDYRYTGHFGRAKPPNMLFFHRTQDFTTGDGKRGLFIGETQSDFAQHVRVARENYANALREREAEKGSELTDDEKKGVWEGERDRLHLPEGVTPEAAHLPYINESARWQLQAFRRALYRAAKEGYDLVGLSPGQEQSRRWQNMGEVYTGLEYDPSQRKLTLTNPAGESHVITSATLEPASEQDAMIRNLGKPMADKVRQLAREGGEGTSEAGPRYTIENQPNDHLSWDVEFEPTDSPDYYYSVESYEHTDEEGNATERWRVIDQDGDPVDEDLDSERAAERSRESLEDALEPQGMWVVRDQDGDTVNEYSTETRARREIDRLERDAQNRWVVLDEDGDMVEEFDDEGDAEGYVERMGGGVPGKYKVKLDNLGADNPYGYQVTGSGFHGTYDKTYVNQINDILKSIDKNLKLTKHSADLPLLSRREGENEGRYARPGVSPDLWEALRLHRMSLEDFAKLPVDEQDRLKKDAGKYHYGHAVRLTPEIREKILKKGVPRYKKGGRVYADGQRLKGPLRQYADGGKAKPVAPGYERVPIGGLGMMGSYIDVPIRPKPIDLLEGLPAYVPPKGGYADGGRSRIDYGNPDTILDMKGLDVVPGSDDSSLVSTLPGPTSAERAALAKIAPIAEMVKMLQAGAPGQGTQGAQAQQGGGGLGSIMKMLPQAMKMFGSMGGGEAANLAGSAPTDAGSWGDVASSAGSFGDVGDIFGSGMTFADGGNVDSGLDNRGVEMAIDYANPDTVMNMDNGVPILPGPEAPQKKDPMGGIMSMLQPPGMGGGQGGGGMSQMIDPLGLFGGMNPLDPAGLMGGGGGGMGLPGMGGGQGGGGGMMGGLFADGGRVDLQHAYDSPGLPEGWLKRLEDPEGKGELDRIYSILDMLRVERPKTNRIEENLRRGRWGLPELNPPGFARGGSVDDDMLAYHIMNYANGGSVPGFAGGGPFSALFGAGSAGSSGLQQGTTGLGGLLGGGSDAASAGSSAMSFMPYLSMGMDAYNIYDVFSTPEDKRRPMTGRYTFDPGSNLWQGFDDDVPEGGQAGSAIGTMAGNIAYFTPFAPFAPIIKEAAGRVGGAIEPIVSKGDWGRGFENLIEGTPIDVFVADGGRIPGALSRGHY